MRALVIGGTGWVGSAVVRAFDQRGIDVVTMSRSGNAFAGEGVRGDVQAHNFGLSKADMAELQSTVTHIVSTFGSVDWGGGPRLAMELHGPGTRAALRFAEGCTKLERFVHLSSVLVLGRRAEESTPIVDELELGSPSAPGTSTPSTSPSASCGRTPTCRGAPCASAGSSARTPT